MIVGGGSLTGQPHFPVAPPPWKRGWLARLGGGGGGGGGGGSMNSVRVKSVGLFHTYVMQYCLQEMLLPFKLHGASVTPSKVIGNKSSVTVVP